MLSFEGRANQGDGTAPWEVDFSKGKRTLAHPFVRTRAVSR